MRRIAVVACAVALVVGFAPAVEAHDPNYWFDKRIYSTSTRYHMAPSFPANNPYPFHDRLPNAASAWPYNNGDSRPLTYFEDNRALTGWTWSEPCDNPWLSQNSSSVTAGGLHFEPRNDPTFGAFTDYCRYTNNPDRIAAVRIVFYSAETWWSPRRRPAATSTSRASPPTSSVTDTEDGPMRRTGTSALRPASHRRTRCASRRRPRCARPMRTA